MSSDYTYDEDGNLWPFFVFTVTTIITLPLTYILLSRTSDPASLFPRIQTDYKPKHGDLVSSQRSKEKRKYRRLGLTLFVLGGWAVMAATMYLIHYTEAPAAQKVWNPYDILGISEVSAFPSIYVIR